MSTSNPYCDVLGIGKRFERERGSWLVDEQGYVVDESEVQRARLLDPARSLP